MGLPNGLKLKRHETFSIREGWLEKGINNIIREPASFSKDNGTRILGLGSNMVKSLRYWVQATNLIEFGKYGGHLTEFGEIIYEYDKFLEDDFSWWFIHLMLVSNFNDAPVFNEIFNSKYSKFDKMYLRSMLEEEFERENYEVKNIASLESDITIFLKSYCVEDESSPENNLICPLSKLNLLMPINKKDYKKNTPNYIDLDYRVVYFALVNFLNPNKIENGTIMFNIEDILTIKNNPIALLNLTPSLFFVYLDEMKKNKMIRLDKTAGLNVVYIDKILNIRELFESKFRGENLYVQ